MAKSPSESPKGVADHPAKDLLRDLWMAGQRGKALAAWLVDNDWPPLSASTIGRYGQRMWSESEVASFEGPLDELVDLAKDLAGSSLVVNKFAFRKQTAPRLDAGVLVDRDTTTLTAEVRPVPQFKPASVPEITIHPPSPPVLLAKPPKTKLGVFLPDMQIGYHRGTEGDLRTLHDEAALDVAFQIVSYLNTTYADEGGVDLVVYAGDNLDFAEFSSHRSAPGYVQTTQLAIDRAGTLCATSRAVAPKAKQIWLTGNHESRAINSLTDKLPGLVGISTENDQKRTPVISVPYLLNMDKYGIEYIEGYPDGEYWANDFLRFEHGSFARSTPGATAAKQLDAGVSTLQGHIHRREILHKRVSTKTGSRMIFAGSPGCLCRIDGLVPSAKTGIRSDGIQGSSRAENWHQGLTVFWYEPKGEQRAWIESVEIEKGQAFFRGVSFTATVDENGGKL